jgi:hypothetical protein
MTEKHAVYRVGNVIKAWFRRTEELAPDPVPCGDGSHRDSSTASAPKVSPIKGPIEPDSTKE